MRGNPKKVGGTPGSDTQYAFLLKSKIPFRQAWLGKNQFFLVFRDFSGNPGSSPLLDDTIDYITIASTGDAQDFGNLLIAMREQGGSSSNTRGLIAGGYTAPANLNTIEFITIATTGNSQDFGDLYDARSLIAGTSDGTRGIFSGGAYTNTIQYVNIASTGDAADFGDLTIAKALYTAISDSHGGLAE